MAVDEGLLTLHKTLLPMRPLNPYFEGIEADDI